MESSHLPGYAAFSLPPIHNFWLYLDGFSSTTDPSFDIPGAHPIHFAGMTHYLTYYVREKGILRLEDAIRKMTSMPATHFRLRGRGLLRPGYYADIVVLDLDRLEEVSTVARPAAYVRGVSFVAVNGELVIDGGEHTGARPGRNLLGE